LSLGNTAPEKFCTAVKRWWWARWRS